jgi:drug/metabolite transporter (DMT)-like permease
MSPTKLETFKTLALIFVSLSFGIAGQFCLKAGVMDGAGRVEISSFNHVLSQILVIFSTPMIWLGLGCYGMGAVTWILALSRADLSYAYPLLGLGYVVTVALSVLIRHEHVSGFRWAGVMLVVLGVIVIGNEAGVKALLKNVLNLKG